MTEQTWVLCDTEQDVYVDYLSVGPDDVAGSPTGWRVQKRTLRGGLQDGVDVVEVDNGTLRFTLIPTRGMSIWRGWIDGQLIGWRSPVRGPVHPRYVSLSDPDGFGWLNGFDELLVRCGLESNGAPDFEETGKLLYPLHGRIGNLPAYRVVVRFDPNTQEISVSGAVEECRFHFQKLRLTTTISTCLNQAGFRLHDEVLNLSGCTTTTQMLYHMNFGPPLLEEGTRLIAPVKTLVPLTDPSAANVSSWDTYTAGQAGAEQHVHLFQLLSDNHDNTQVLLKNASENCGVNLIYNVEQLPCFTQWKNPVAEADGEVTGLEPGTNYPNCRSFEKEQGRVVKLDPGQHVDYDLEMNFCRSAREVLLIEKEIATLQASAEPLIHDTPQDSWCAG